MEKNEQSPRDEQWKQQIRRLTNAPGERSGRRRSQRYARREQLAQLSKKPLGLAFLDLRQGFAQQIVEQRPSPIWVTVRPTQLT